MSPEGKQRIQLALGLAIAIAGVRAAYIMYERHEETSAEHKQTQARDVGYANKDYYVTPKKLYPFDLKSARQLLQQPAWVKEGYRYTYYPYDAAAKRANFGHEAGLLGPIEKLSIKDVAIVSGPNGRQMVAIFQKDAKSVAVPIGAEADQQWKIYSDEMFYIEDPHDLYKYWPSDIWQAVEQHQVKPGMNELQADFAVGMGVPDAGASSDEKTVHYANGGKPLTVIYHGDKASDIKAGS